MFWLIKFSEVSVRIMKTISTFRLPTGIGWRCSIWAGHQLDIPSLVAALLDIKLTSKQICNQTSCLRSKHCSGSTLLCISVQMWAVVFQKGPQGNHLYFPLKQLKYYSAINLTCMDNFWKNGSAWIFKLLFIIALIITNCCRAKKAISKLFRHYSWQSKVAAEAIKPKLYLLFIEKLRNCFKNLFALKETTLVQFQLP